MPPASAAVQRIEYCCPPSLTKTGPCGVIQLAIATGAAPFTAIDVALQSGLLLAPLEKIAARIQIDLFAIQILNVELQVRDAPRDAVVVPRDHARDSDDGRARDI